MILFVQPWCLLQLLLAQEVLLEAGAAINALDMNKQSALHAAAFLLMDDMVEASGSRLAFASYQTFSLLEGLAKFEGGGFKILFLPTLMR